MRRAIQFWKYKTFLLKTKRHANHDNLGGTDRRKATPKHRDTRIYKLLKRANR